MSQLIDIISLSSDSEDGDTNTENASSIRSDKLSAVDKVKAGKCVKKTTKDLKISDNLPVLYTIDKIPYVHTVTLEDMTILKKNFHIYVPNDVIKRIEIESKPKSFRRRQRKILTPNIKAIARVKYNIAKIKEYARLKKHAINNNYYHLLKLCKPLTIDFTNIKRGIPQYTYEKRKNSLHGKSKKTGENESRTGCGATRRAIELPTNPNIILKDNKKKKICESDVLPETDVNISAQKESQTVFYPLIKKVKNVEDINREFEERYMPIDSVNTTSKDDNFANVKSIATNSISDNIYDKTIDANVTFAKEQDTFTKQMLLNSVNKLIDYSAHSKPLTPESTIENTMNTANSDVIGKVLQNFELQQVVRLILERFQYIRIIISADGQLAAHIDKTICQNVLSPSDYQTLGTLLARAQNIIKSLKSIMESNVSIERLPVNFVKIAPKNNSKNSHNTVSIEKNLTMSFIQLCEMSSEIAALKRKHYLSNFGMLIYSTSITKSSIRLKYKPHRFDVKQSQTPNEISMDSPDSNTDKAKQHNADILNFQANQNNANTSSHSITKDSNNKGQFITIIPTPVTQNIAGNTQDLIHVSQPQALPIVVPTAQIPPVPNTTGQVGNLLSLPYNTNLNPVYVLVTKKENFNKVDNVPKTVVNNLTGNANLQTAPFPSGDILKNTFIESVNNNGAQIEASSLKMTQDCNERVPPWITSNHPQLTKLLNDHRNPQSSQIVDNTSHASGNHKKGRKNYRSSKITHNFNAGVPPGDTSNLPQLYRNDCQSPQTSRSIENTLIGSDNNKKDSDNNVPSYTPTTSYLSQFTRNIQENKRSAIPELITNVHQNPQSSQRINNESKSIDWESRIASVSLIATNTGIPTIDNEVLSNNDEPMMPRISTVFTLNTRSNSFGKFSKHVPNDIVCLSDSD